MWIYIIIAAILATASFAGYSACKSPSGDKKNTDEQPRDTVKNKFTKKEIIAKLAELKEKPIPQKLNPGAMCYAKVAYSDTAYFVCPICNHRTAYTNYYSQIIKLEVPKAKAIAARIKTINIKIEDKNYCDKCRPKNENPGMCLIVSYPDDPVEHRSCTVSSTDLTMIEEFLAGSTVFHVAQDEERPMKDNIPRLEELLGITIKK
ncbi:MAG: hypothetical protein V2A54_16910 [Bacteroidota bacterium]